MSSSILIPLVSFALVWMIRTRTTGPDVPRHQLPMTNQTSREHAGGSDMLEAARREKLGKLIEMGIDPWGGAI